MPRCMKVSSYELSYILNRQIYYYSGQIDWYAPDVIRRDPTVKLLEEAALRQRAVESSVRALRLRIMSLPDENRAAEDSYGIRVLVVRGWEWEPEFRDHLYEILF
ncbi:hypothetical protein TWF281_008977 [Arthrobotrys megalospora]